MPIGVHVFFILFFGSEAESSSFMLFATALAAGATGAFLGKLKYGPVASSLAAPWPSVLAAWRHWHWALGMPSPGGSAQSLARAAGWADAPMPAAVAAAMILSGAAGWLMVRVDRWYEGKTGHSFFEES
ncbi:MAG: hypothetical protein PHS14_08145 [Elusimicrobia bacterium]|nr:hypothetical protein [Elusimicrobiota bacterium]